MTYLVKLLVVGESFVGKTTLIQRFVADEFITGIRNTIGVDFFLKQITRVQFEGLREGDELDLQIWDISGESRFREILPMYSSGTQGIILCFDSKRNLDKLDIWITFLKTIVPESIPYILLKTKSDLKENRIEQNLIDEFIKKHNCTEYYVTSAKDGSGVLDAFVTLAKIIYKRIDE